MTIRIEFPKDVTKQADRKLVERRIFALIDMLDKKLPKNRAALTFTYSAKER